ncbi:MAG TPA: DUF4375 domain-containing protein [Verrucomicrobiae bacterium]|nr:DUF4375 domain-containing protein [Verrucomicrobiae bacterium]
MSTSTRFLKPETRNRVSMVFKPMVTQCCACGGVGTASKRAPERAALQDTVRRGDGCAAVAYRIYPEIMRKVMKPWLDYTGQASSEILACKETHRIDSLLCALEWGIRAKAETIGEERLTKEERVVLAVMALEREVNNGGYSQFFSNSSRRFKPIVAEALRRIGCDDVARITERAIGAAGSERKTILEACDQEFYKIGGIEDKLFGFVEANQAQIQFEKGTDPKLPKIGGQMPVSVSLDTRLRFAKVTDLSLEGLRAGDCAKGRYCGYRWRDRARRDDASVRRSRRAWRFERGIALGGPCVRGLAGRPVSLRDPQAVGREVARSGTAVGSRSGDEDVSRVFEQLRSPGPAYKKRDRVLGSATEGEARAARGVFGVLPSELSRSRFGPTASAASDRADVTYPFDPP